MGEQWCYIYCIINYCWLVYLMEAFMWRHCTLREFDVLVLLRERILSIFTIVM